MCATNAAKIVAEHGDTCNGCGYVYEEGERMHRHPQAAWALVLMLVIALGGCASVAKPRTPPNLAAETQTISVVSWLVPRYSYFHGGRVWRRVEERFGSIADADTFMASFSVKEIRILDVKREDFIVTDAGRLIKADQ